MILVYGILIGVITMGLIGGLIVSNSLQNASIAGDRAGASSRTAQLFKGRIEELERQGAFVEAKEPEYIEDTYKGVELSGRALGKISRLERKVERQHEKRLDEMSKVEVLEFTSDMTQVALFDKKFEGTKGAIWAKTGRIEDGEDSYDTYEPTFSDAGKPGLVHMASHYAQANFEIHKYDSGDLEMNVNMDGWAVMANIEVKTKISTKESPALRNVLEEAGAGKNRSNLELAAGQSDIILSDIRKTGKKLSKEKGIDREEKVQLLLAKEALPSALKDANMANAALQEAKAIAGEASPGLDSMSEEEISAKGLIRVKGFTKADGTKVKNHYRKL